MFNKELESCVCALDLSTDHCGVLFKTEVAILIDVILNPEFFYSLRAWAEDCVKNLEFINIKLTILIRVVCV